jgi:indole-3-glycerol phosphate synthase
MFNDVQIIAEIKTKSPFGYKSKKTWDELFEIANKSGDIISVHTDPRWGGSLNLIKKAKILTIKPILAKGFHKTDEEVRQAIESGADYVLTVGRIPEIYKDKCLIEPLNLQELKNIPESLKVVWNSRDLSNGKSKKETFEQARKIFKGWLCQASYVKTVSDIKSGANAVLVGTHLTDFIESIKKDNFNQLT